MSNEKAADSNSHASPGGGSRKSSPILLILFLLNTVAIAGALGFFYYSKFIFKRPAITESAERARIEEKYKAPPPPENPILVPFDPMTINISSAPDDFQTEGQAPTSGTKLHYLTLAFALEIRDKSRADLIEELKPLIVDKIISIIGKKKFHELDNVNGRYLLNSQLVDGTNEVIASKSKVFMKEGLVTNTYFSQFIVQ